MMRWCLSPPQNEKRQHLLFKFLKKPNGTSSRQEPLVSVLFMSLIKRQKKCDVAVVIINEGLNTIQEEQSEQEIHEFEG